MERKNKTCWPVISFCSIMVFTNVTIFTMLNTKFNLPLYAIVVIAPMIFWPALKFVLSEVGYIKKIKEKWFKFPNIVHQGTSLFCLFWSTFFILKVIIPFLKKDYAKDK